ncbi:MAG: A/G-specific adenine glycosylase [Thermoanaerobaculia bacterium]
MDETTHPVEDGDVLAALERARTALTRWYEDHRRDLPWRRTRDPYRIWVSEVMLQQTRVEVVVPYFERFLERFPDVGALAAAAESEVLSLWSGLGYYGRARRLHAAAREIVRQGGKIPADLVGLSRLPGVGRYTAAAVASIAYGEPVAVLDGNVERVGSRLLASVEDPKRASARRRLEAVAEALLDPADPGRSNQALMELGATVCTPRSPDCSSCPLAGLCRARILEEVERYPPPRTRRRPVRIELAAALVLDGGRVLLMRRAEEESLLPGTWELPWCECGGDLALDLELDLARRYGGSWTLTRRIGTVRHAITHRDIRLQLYDGRLTAGASIAERSEAGWFRQDEIARLPVSSLVTKALRLLG